MIVQNLWLFQGQRPLGDDRPQCMIVQNFWCFQVLVLSGVSITWCVLAYKKLTHKSKRNESHYKIHQRKIPV